MTVVIVGVGPGLGASLVERFSRDGTKVAMFARSRSTLDAIKGSARLQGRNLAGFAVDAGDFSALGAALDAATEWGGVPSVMIYNAVTFNGTSADALTVEALSGDLKASLLGAVRSVEHVLSGMLARREGTILLTGGGLALNPVEAWASVAVAKAGLRAYAHALAKAVGSKGIHAATVTICGLIEPGGDFDPDLIAQIYWDLHQQKPGAFESEVIYSPEGSDKDYNETK